MAIQIKTIEQLKQMRVAGLVVAEALRLMKEAIEPGVTTLDLDAIAVKVLKENKATPKRHDVELLVLTYVLLGNK